MLDSAPPLEQRPPVKVLSADLDRPVAELVEHPDRRTAEVGPGLVAAVAGEGHVHHRQPAAADEHRAAPTALLERPGRVAAGEREVAQHELGSGLVLAVRRGPRQSLVAGVLVEDPVLPAAAEGDQPATVDDDLPAGSLWTSAGPVHDDRHRVGTAVEGDPAARGDGLPERLRGAAGGRPVADHAVRRSRRLHDGSGCGAGGGASARSAMTRSVRSTDLRLGQEPEARRCFEAVLATRSAASASRASALSDALRPELHTPVESRSMVLTERGATGLET